MNYQVGFGNRLTPVPPELEPYWASRPVWKQVHQDRSVRINEPQQPCGETDSLWTTQMHLPISVVTADCVPIILIGKHSGNPDAFAVAAVHAGWRGTFTRIVQKTISTIARDTSIKDIQWEAHIGPCIGACCYDVSEAIAKQFTNEFEGYLPRADVKSIIQITDGRPLLDLAFVNQLQLNELGVEQIHLSKQCTKCSVLITKPKNHARNFFSYRAGDLIARQYSGAILL